MQNKIDIPGTTISLEIIDKIITVTNKIKYDIQMQFKNQDAEPSLDESGDIFEPQVLEIVLDLLKNDSKTGAVLPLNINDRDFTITIEKEATN